MCDLSSDCNNPCRIICFDVICHCSLFAYDINGMFDTTASAKYIHMLSAGKPTFT